MDTSIEFIKMCEKAVEIQKECLYAIGDIFSVIWDEKGCSGGLQGCILQREPIYGLEYNNCEWWLYNGKINNKHCKHKLFNNSDVKNVIWLPRQDQLQEMMCGKNILLATILSKFFAFCFPYKSSIYIQNRAKRANYTAQFFLHTDKSVEKLWLAFVMLEKFKKRWNEKDWE